MSKSVATAGEVSATASTGPATATVAGSAGNWTAPPPITVETDSRAKINGNAVALSAKQTFAFKGQNASGSPVTDSSDVTLDAKPTKFKVGCKSVLVDGDTKDDSAVAKATPANTISVSSSLKLKTGNA